MPDLDPLVDQLARVLCDDEPVCHDCVSGAGSVLKFLANAGRLLPDVRWHAGDDTNAIRDWLGGFATQQAAADASLTKIGEYGITRATFWCRERRDYGEQGHWTGPWVEVPDA